MRSPLLVAPAALALALAACMQPARVAPALPDADVAAWAAIIAAADARSADTVVYAAGLSSTSHHLRRYATLAVGQAGVRALAPRLRAAMLADRDTGVAANAAFALGLLRDTAAVGDLARTACDGAPRAADAAWSLGEIGEPARAAILATLGDRGCALDLPDGPTALLYAAAKLRPVPVHEVLRTLAAVDGRHVSDHATARAATYALSRVRVAAGVRTLLAFVAADDAETRAHVARGIALPAAGDSLADTALAVLGRLAYDRDARVRVNAARSLATFGSRGAERVLQLARDGDPNVRLAAAQSAGPLLAADSTLWGSLWASDTAFAFRASLLRGGVAVAAGRDTLAAWAGAGEWRARAAAAEAAATTAAATRFLPALVGDADARVREAALRAVGAFADSAGPVAWVRDTLVAHLSDADALARAAALGALATRPRAAELAAVLDAYARSRGDVDNDARLAAVRLLVAAWRRDSLAVPPAVVARLRALPVPADPLERRAADGASAFTGWSTAHEKPRPSADYVGTVRDLVLPALGGRLPRATLATERGPIELELFALDAPLTVRNFLALAGRGFYDGGRFHRVVPNFVAQGGDPRGNGSGGPGHAIRDELNRRTYARGALGMALSGPDTGGSQWFMTHAAQPHLDGHYTVFGRVRAGHEALDRLVQGDRLERVTAR